MGDMGAIHPRRDDAGRLVRIQRPSKPTPAAAWRDPSATVVVVPGGAVPRALHDIRMAPWRPPSAAGAWEAMAAGMTLTEPAFAAPAGLEPAAGVVLVEPDGRIWLAQPTNAFGGAAHVVPKGRLDAGSTLVATAMREAWEELGLLVKLTDYLVDVARSVTFTRYYLGRRMAGSVADMGAESQGAVLAPVARLPALLNGPHDAALVETIVRHAGGASETR